MGNESQLKVSEARSWLFLSGGRTALFFGKDTKMEKLYYDSPYLKKFEATVVSCEAGKKGYQVVLDQTAFYPEGGGQPADTGSLGGVRVLDVHEKDGVIVHLTDQPLTVGAKVRGQIDWERRFLHMQEHSGEHLVSGLIHERFGYDNVGFHMGADEVTIDFNGMIAWDELMEIEEKANAMIWENLPIRAWFPSSEELAAMEYRSKKELTGEVRIVEIPGGDTCACCGTHVARTGEIGLVKFLSLIHYKGGVRLSLLCGGRAVRDYENKQEQVQKISVLLSAKPAEIARAVERVKNELEEIKGKLAESHRELTEYEVAALPENGGDLYLIRKDYDGLRLRNLANRILEEKKAKKILILSETKEDTFLYVLGSQDEDIRPLAKELNGLLHGRGGGSMQMVQGTFFMGVNALCTILKEKGFSSPAPYNGTGAPNLSSYA